VSFFLVLSADQHTSLRFSSTAGQQNIETSGREVQGKKMPKKATTFSPNVKGLEEDAFGKDENAEYSVHD